MMVRLFSILLLLIFPAAVQAQFTYTTNNSAVIITKYTGPGGDVVIPDTIVGLPVTTIEGSGSGLAYMGAFQGCNTLTSVTIPNSVTNIGFQVFSYCYSLTNITIPESVTSIGGSACCYCTNLSSVTIPKSVISFGGGAFAHCSSLTSVTIQKGVISIGAGAFSVCTGLTNISIPNSVTTISEGAFRDCRNLTSVTIASSVTNLEVDSFGFSRNLSVFFQGDAPVAYHPFQFSSNTTAYYLPGTKGWGAPYFDAPAVLWNPYLKGISVQGNQVGFTITGTPSIPMVAEASTVLGAGWTPLQTCTLTNGSIYFSDAAWTNYPRRFYRIRSP
jgi:hypothetical protein